MMPRNTLRFVIDAMTNADIESWSLGFWFVVPFAAVGYFLQAFWSDAFERAAIAGLFAATASVVVRIIFKHLSREDAEARYHGSARAFGKWLPARQADGNGRHRAGGE